MAGRRTWARLVPLALALAAASAHAGRHGVEPAAMLDAGECELEVTPNRLQGGVTAIEAEFACGLGFLQLGGEAEYEREPPDSSTGWALEAKWSRDLGDWTLGLFLQSGWLAHERPRHSGVALTGLASYRLREDLQLHLNVGREFVRGGEDGPRSGVGIEWEVRPAWSLMAERYVRDETHFARGTVRYSTGPWSFALGHAHRLSGPEPSRWILTVSREFDVD